MIDLHNELLLLSLFVTTSIVCKFLVWLWFCAFYSSATISLMKRELIDLHIELLLLSLFVATSIMCESFLFDSGFVLCSSSATISLMKKELIDLHIELLLLSLFVATSILCESFLFDSGFVPFYKFCNHLAEVESPCLFAYCVLTFIFVCCLSIFYHLFFLVPVN